MKYKVLVTAPYLQPIIENYRAIFASHQIETIVPPLKERLSESELLGYIKDIDGIIAGNDEITEKVPFLVEPRGLAASVYIGNEAYNALCRVQKELNKEGDNEPIGVILCTEKNHVQAEFALSGIGSKMFVSKYKLYLPTKEELEMEVRGML